MKKETSYIIKVSLGRRCVIKYGVVIFVMGLITLTGMGLGLYNVAKGNLIYGICYLIAVLFGIIYLVIEAHSLFSTYIGVDKTMLTMKNWENGFFPYNMNHKIGFLREFIPSKTELSFINLEDIECVLIGSYKYVMRYCDEDSSFVDKIKEFEQASPLYKNRLQRMELLYIQTNQSESCCMSVQNFDEMQLTRLLNYLEKRTNATIKCNNPTIKKYRKLIQVRV